MNFVKFIIYKISLIIPDQYNIKKKMNISIKSKKYYYNYPKI